MNELEILKTLLLKRKANLENNSLEQRALERIYGIKPQNTILDNLEYGIILNFLRRTNSLLFFLKISARVHNYVASLQKMYASGSEITSEDFLDIIGRTYDSSFWDGYNEKKSEELAELILTEPYNRISKN